MTRKKKSRKPTSGSVGISKADMPKKDMPQSKKPKKKTGKPAGTRQQEALKRPKAKSSQQANKDPRIGSKKPIELIATPKAATPKPVKQKPSAIAAIKVLDHEKTITDRITEIEQDEQLQAILAKQDDGIELTEQEVNYFNQLMDEHEELSAQVDPEQEETTEKASDEDELWDRLDNTDFSDY